MGWEPATTYLYDEAGRLISSQLEVEWDDTERDWMLALQHHRTEVTCHLCGLPKSVCRDYETDGHVLVEFERCHVSAALARKQKANADADMEFPESLAYSAGVKPV